MDFENKRLTIREARKIDLVNYLSSLGHEPAKIRKNDYWYLSPLREENTASFKVNRRLNKWYDHGIGEGGNLVDFAIRYHHCTVGELLKKLNDGFSFQKPLIHHSKIDPEPENRIKIVGDFHLRSPALLHYLKQRRIPVSIANQYCREVRYNLKGKTYYGIGFKNDQGGFEIRNLYFKAGSSPKGITTFHNDSNETVVFEGFMDFLSFKTLHQNEAENRPDFVVLNSIALFEKARSFMEKHQSIRLYLDRDKAGQNCSQYALSLNKKYKDESGLYQNHKDLNDWLMNFGRSQRKHFKQSPG